VRIKRGREKKEDRKGWARRTVGDEPNRMVESKDKAS